ncbi:MAG: RHS repeat domain-containing protein, partial [Bryobacteraceae bacterium]
YDGNGQRVQKTGPGGTTTYIYDAFGNLAAEYGAVQGNPPCTTCYLTYDHLGSVRMVTDQNGNVVARHDFLPFGEEIPANTAGRNGQWGSTSDVEQKFTGQIRDNETGMDFFQARYFTNALGRFNSPDPENAGADPADPQTWNAYAYVRNNPLALIDPSGLTTCDANGNHCQDTITVTAQPPDPIQLLTVELTNSYNENGDDDPRSPQPHPLITLPLSLTRPASSTCIAGYGAAGAVLGGRAGWVGGGAAGILGSETGPFDIAIAYGGKVLTSDVGAYVGFRAGQLLGNIFCASSTGGGGDGGPGSNPATKHGTRRLAQRRFSPEEIANTKAGEQFEQSDGAIAYVKKMGRNSYNVLVENPDGEIITALKNISRNEVKNLAANYGWH